MFLYNDMCSKDLKFSIGAENDKANFKESFLTTAQTEKKKNCLWNQLSKKLSVAEWT